MPRQRGLSRDFLLTGLQNEVGMKNIILIIQVGHRRIFLREIAKIPRTHRMKQFGLYPFRPWPCIFHLVGINLATRSQMFKKYHAFHFP